MTDTPPDPSPKLDIDWLRTLAGALAAVSTAVLLSTLGAAGTLIGAAVGSVAATVGTALYTQGLATSRQKVAKAQETALQKVGIAQAEVRRAARLQGDEAAAEAHLGHADEQLDAARDKLDTDTDTDIAPGWRERLAALSWRRIGLLAGGTFVVVVLALLVFELVGGKPVSSFTGGTDGSGGTSISRLTGSGGESDDGDRGDDGKQQERDEQAPDGEPSEGPTDGATEAPTEVPGETPTPSAEPSETPTETPTELGGTSEPAPSAPPTGPAG